MVVNGREGEGQGDVRLIVLVEFVERAMVDVSLDLYFVVVVEAINLTQSEKIETSTF